MRDRKGLTQAQAEQVARRLNPREGQSVLFSAVGVVLHTTNEIDGALAMGEVYRAVKSEGSLTVTALRGPSTFP